MTAEHDTIALARKVCGLLGYYHEHGEEEPPEWAIWWHAEAPALALSTGYDGALRSVEGGWPPLVGILAEEMARRDIDIIIDMAGRTVSADGPHHGPFVHHSPTILDAMLLACRDALGGGEVPQLLTQDAEVIRETEE